MSERDNNQLENEELLPPKKSSRLKAINLLLLVVLVFVFLFVGIQFLKPKPSNEPVASFNSEEKQKDKVKDIATTLKVEVIELGEFNETAFVNNQVKPFDIFFSNDEKTEEYGFYRDDQQTELIIIPTSTKYEVEITKVEMKDKNISISYKYGTPKIPRVSGHIRKFEAKAFVIDFRSIDSAIYNLKLENELGEEMQEEEFNFTKPFYRSKWEVTNLTWGKDDQLVFAANMDGKWELFSQQIGVDNEPKKLTERHEDLPLDIMATLGSENINIPVPKYNVKTDKIVYHSQQDIFEVHTDGSRNYPLTITETGPERDALHHFDNEPHPTHSGDFIYYRRIYDPQTSELWRMYYDGTNKTKIKLPNTGYVEEVLVSPKDDQLAVVLSNRQSDLVNGQSELWVYPIDGKELGEPRRITTVGYKVQDINMSSNNKAIAFSMKEHSTTSDLSTDIWKVNSNNTELTRLTPLDNYMDIRPVWSPDGKQIAYLSGKGDYLNLWIMDSNGEGRKALNRKIQATGTPLWSPDSKRVYISDIKGNVFEFNLEENMIYRVVKGY